MTTNLILQTDSYKMAHWPIYPDHTQALYSYLESRGGDYPYTVMFGTEYYLRKYLQTRITHEMIDYAEQRMVKHFGDGRVFNRAGWEHIVDAHGGKLPLRIKAVPEGTIVPTRNVLMTIENTDPKCAWLVNYVETIMLKLWYPITVATKSREIKRMISAALDKTGDPSGLPFKLHDFGYRGASSEESAAIGGAAHLINFLGTDTFAALEFIEQYYGEDMAGFSIPATEHSLMCARGETGEVEQMKRFLDTFGGGNYPAIACVSDTYDIYNACENLWGKVLKNDVLKLDGKVLVVRPDSGTPHVVVVQVIETLDRAFGHVTNDKGYKVLNNVRVIQGDGINQNEIRLILDAMLERKWSADNIAFGMGGALLQQCNRDTLKFAFKASSITIKNDVKDIWKSPVTDTGKRSKRGRMKLVRDDSGVLQTVNVHDIGHDELITVFEDGEVLNSPTFAEIRERAVLTDSIQESVFA